MTVFVEMNEKTQLSLFGLAGFSYQPILTMLQVGTSIHMIQTFSLTDALDQTFTFSFTNPDDYFLDSESN